ncbi:unnamed protein product [Brassica rapa]|uniref:Thymidine kinase n=2 Tax=Brassica campestris TaxID=3711 RepID=A0A8D9GEC9_BRACM|nr:unnamed protein product [Brassica rapa]
MSNISKPFTLHKSSPTILFHSSTSASLLYIHHRQTIHHPYPKPQASLSLSPPHSLAMATLKASVLLSDISRDEGHLGSGAIHVITGPMFSGKSTSLLRRIKTEISVGRSVAMVKSSKDTRYAKDSVVTHDGIGFPCWALPDLMSFPERFGQDAYDKLDEIGIDEAQFFGDLYEFCCKVADVDGKTVIVAGLDGDYLRRRFGAILDIIPIADSVTKLTARCEVCGQKGFFTLRKTCDTRTELIGGADVYMPVCRKHYVNNQIVINASKKVLGSEKARAETCVKTIADMI